MLMASSSRATLSLFFSSAFFLLRLCLAADLVVHYEFTVSYAIASPLGVPQQVITINDRLPGTPINVTTNNFVSVNVQNNLDEPFLLTWPGIQMRQNSWQDGVLGTNCPIPAGWNWTYNFQVKDQIGSYFYFPSLSMQRAAGGFGGFVVKNRRVIPLPFAAPDKDIFLFIGDWYSQNHTALRKHLDDGKALGMPDGVVINGKGPCRYNDTLVAPGIVCEQIVVQKGKTYHLHVHNVGVFLSLNLRIQNHSMVLVESEGSYTVQQNYTSLDIHVGQSYSFLLTMDQHTNIDYYIVASARFINESIWKNLTGVALLCYTKCKGKTNHHLPPGPQDQYDKTYSMNEARSIRWNVTASGARPNPQGSFRYGEINVTEVYVLKSKSTKINGKLRMIINGVSFVNARTPIKLADEFRVSGSYKLGFPNSTNTAKPQMETSIINGTYRGFMEIVLQNNSTRVKSYHMDGYAFFVVGMDYGDWTENSRGTYNRWDGIARCTIQVFPNAWSAILVSLDNVGVWNLRSENLDSWYLGEETYIKVVNPEMKSMDSPVPDNALYCGALQSKQKPQQAHSTLSSGNSGPEHIFVLLLVLGSALFFIVQ